MSKYTWEILVAILLILTGGGLLLFLPRPVVAPQDEGTPAPSPDSIESSRIPASPSTQPSPLVSSAEPVLGLQEPIADMKNRVTKKPFGIFITPDNSPVDPERFTGYHTGADVEYDDVSGDVPVKAIAAGEVTAARNASGYGGVVVIRHTIDGQQVQSLYGHLDPASMPSGGKRVEAGEQIGILGDGYTPETDGERKHLHFAIIKGVNPEIRGYVQNESELSAWHDPVEFLGL